MGTDEITPPARPGPYPSRPVADRKQRDDATGGKAGRKRARKRKPAAPSEPEAPLPDSDDTEDPPPLVDIRTLGRAVLQVAT